jgi:hypothetical protein
MLSALRDEEVVRIGCNAKLRKSGDHAVVMMGKGLMRQIAEKPLERTVSNDVLEDRGDRSSSRPYVVER